MKRPRRPLRSLGYVAGSAPINYDALYNLATTLARDGRMAEARPSLERFVRTAPPSFYGKDIREVSASLGK